MKNDGAGAVKKMLEKIVWNLKISSWYFLFVLFVDSDVFFCLVIDANLISKSGWSNFFYNCMSSVDR